MGLRPDHRNGGLNSSLQACRSGAPLLCPSRTKDEENTTRCTIWEGWTAALQVKPARLDHHLIGRNSADLLSRSAVLRIVTASAAEKPQTSAAGLRPHCSVCFEFVQIVVGDLQSLQRWVGHFAFVLHKIVLHVPVMTRCRKQLLPIDGPEASFCVGVFVLGVEGCRDMIARHQILDV